MSFTSEAPGDICGQAWTNTTLRTPEVPSLLVQGIPVRNLGKSVLLLTAGVAAGAVMAPSSVQAAINYFDTTKIVNGTGSVSCPYGWKLTGGGTYPLPSNYYGSSSSDEYELTGSYPASATQWKGTAHKVHGSYTSSYGWKFSTYSYNPRVYAICAS